MNEANLRTMETQWHKIYIGWHAILGQLKVRERQDETPPASRPCLPRRRNSTR